MKKAYTLAVLTLTLIPAINGFTSGFGIRDKIRGKFERFVADPAASLQRGTEKLTGYTAAASGLAQSTGAAVGELSRTAQSFQELPGQMSAGFKAGLKNSINAQ